ncbi:response regulator transcription factor [Calidifontibacter sp. DB0510]|uniref:Response regulator transcription factor n=1 Tax=Metallococcus carri TaxID=1656884 RepID=A0A967B087_9MICO|nr:response regulator transcription factor [Metallococcus carri]NHN55629.1 response regulator transcription factor [Metallococcus carri]NOP38187.1 response regulator transcription factor [Calidifontibacter sp. DB2511S]
MTPISPSRVLVVDDEVALAGMVGNYLDRAGYTVQLAHDGLAALEAARAFTPDVVVLDLGLPGLDGIEVCRQLRTFSDAYVLMLTARTEEVDTLIGLSVGADDYVTKPFSVRELVARIGVLLRRPRTATTEPVVQQVGRLRLDLEAHEVLLEGRSIPLTRTEFDVLATLAAQPRRAFDRRALIDAVWGAGWGGDEHLVDTHVAHLRAKLGREVIATVRGVGYRMGRP